MHAGAAGEHGEGQGPEADRLTTASESEPPPPPPSKPAKPRRHIMARPPNGLGKKGQPIHLLANHYKVSVKPSEDFFNHYYVISILAFFPSSRIIYPTHPPSFVVITSCHPLTCSSL